MDAPAVRLQRRAQEGAGGTLAIGAGDMEHRRKRVLGIAEAGKEMGDALQPEHVGAGAEREQAIELALDGGVGGGGAVHSALSPEGRGSERHHAASRLGLHRKPIRRPSVSRRSLRSTTISIRPCSR